MLEARELLCERDERTLFSGLSFTLNAGEWVQITGSNGAGKTTLLRLLTGLSRPDAGEVLWQGQPLHQVRDSYHIYIQEYKRIWPLNLKIFSHKDQKS